MFTGIIEEVGEVVAVADLPDHARQLRIRGPLVVSDVAPGDSISVNGVCLTVVDPDVTTFAADIMSETLSRSSLGAVTVGSPVNLERAVAVGDRLGGHIVSGHVDGAAQVVARTDAEHWRVLTLSLPPTLDRLIAEKGSVTLDGVSLTVAGVGDDFFTVSLIPTTLAATTLGALDVGSSVNVEVDMLARYVERMLESR